MRFSTKEIAEILKVTDRSVRRYLKSYISFENKGIKISEKMLEILKKEYLSGQITDSQNNYDIVEGFSSEEYQEFQKRLIEYPLLKEQVEYHKKAAESHRIQMEKIISVLEQRNYLEAADKIKNDSIN